MKKSIAIVFLIFAVSLVAYFGVIRQGFAYYTGIGTEYSYFKAKKALNDTILTIYAQKLYNYMWLPEQDSLDLEYGFRIRVVEEDVSNYVISSYNSLIDKELKRRLGNRWNEYLFKLDSLHKSNQTLLYYPSAAADL